jgi:hypothetical protein
MAGLLSPPDEVPGAIGLYLTERGIPNNILTEYTPQRIYIPSRFALLMVVDDGIVSSHADMLNIQLTQPDALEELCDRILKLPTSC